MGVFEMPSLGADMEAGRLVEWLVKPGDAVKRGDVVAVVETQKGAIEIETFQAGKVHHLEAELGQELPVGAPLAVILGEGEKAPATELPVNAVPAPPRPKSEPEPEQPPAIARTEQHPAPKPMPHTSSTGGLMASPAARRRAAELGVDLTSVTGTGLGGAIQLADLEQASEETSKAIPIEPTTEKPTSAMAEMRKAIAAAMSRSNRDIPHLHVSQTIDIEPATRWLEATNQSREPAQRLLLGALFVHASAMAAARVPVVNGQYSDDGFKPSKVVNAGMAIALRGGGLVAPAVMAVETLTLDETMVSMRDLVTRARAGRLRGSEMSMGTITISALGETGAEAMTGVIFPPQVALVCIGAPQRRAWVLGDELVVRRTVTITLSLDHRVGDGRQAARFLSEFETIMQTPEAL